MSRALRLESGKNSVRLLDHDPEESFGLDKRDVEERAASVGAELADLLDLLAAAGRNGLLLVLQGMDTSGKDGIIRHLLTYCEVQSVRVCPFKVPTEEELAHDFLWRVHAVAPRRGAIHIFNRSHYEDVLVVRVHELVPEAVWRGRFEHIVNFERLLTDSGVIVLKFFLHISKDEQEKRLLEREEDAVKSWKLSVGDWKERELWGRYQEAYEDVLGRTATGFAPWLLVPANRKWLRNLLVSEAIVEALRPYREAWMDHLSRLGEKARGELDAFRRGK